MLETPGGRFSFSRGLQLLLLCALLLLSVLIVLGQANPFTTRLGRDSGMYAYVASHVLRGDTPYVSAWEHKPPTIFFIDALGLWLGRGTRWGIWAIELIFLFVGAAASFSAIRRHFGFGPALLGTLVWLAGLGLVLEGGNLTEEYSLLFSFVSLWLFTLILQRPGALWPQLGLGLMFGLSFLTRPNNAGVPAAIILTQVLLFILRPAATDASPDRPQTPRALISILAATLAGFLLPAAASAIYFLARGAFQDFIDAAFIYNLSYGGQPAPIESFLGGIRNLGFAAGIGLVGMWLAFGRLRLGLRDRRVEPLILWLCLDFVLEVVLSGLSGLNYPHYFISWLPWIAFASALLFSRASESFAAWLQRYQSWALVGAIVLIGVTFLGTVRGYDAAFLQLIKDRTRAQQIEQVPQYVNEHTRPGQTVFVWGGDAGINFLAGRDSPTPHFQYGILVPSAITDRISAQFYQDITTRRPALILDQSDEELPPLDISDPLSWAAAHGLYAPPYLQQFFDFVHTNYSYKTSVAGVAIYTLNP